MTYKDLEIENQAFGNLSDTLLKNRMMKQEQADRAEAKSERQQAAATSATERQQDVEFRERNLKRLMDEQTQAEKDKQDSLRRLDTAEAWKENPDNPANQATITARIFSPESGSKAHFSGTQAQLNAIKAAHDAKNPDKPMQITDIEKFAGTIKTANGTISYPDEEDFKAGQEAWQKANPGRDFMAAPEPKPSGQPTPETATETDEFDATPEVPGTPAVEASKGFLGFGAHPASPAVPAIPAVPKHSITRKIPAPPLAPGLQNLNPNPTNAPAAGPVTPQSQDEFDALPSGALYINPADGKQYRKK